MIKPESDDPLLEAMGDLKLAKQAMRVAEQNHQKARDNLSAELERHNLALPALKAAVEEAANVRGQRSRTLEAARANVAHIIEERTKAT